MLGAITLSAIAGAFGLLGPLITQKALDEAIPAGDYKYLFILVGLLILVFAVGIIFAIFRSKIMVNVSQNIIYDIRKDIFK